MKSRRKVLTLHVPAHTGFVNITQEAASTVRDSGIKAELCLVNPMHITSSVFLNDERFGLNSDCLRWLEKLPPCHASSDSAQGGYLHNRTGEDKGAAHHQRQIMGARWSWPSPAAG